MKHQIFFALILFSMPSFASVLNDVINISGETRHYRLFIPEQVSNSPLPIVINLHGTGSTPLSQNELSEFETLASEHGFFVLSPAAIYIPKSKKLKTWNVDKDPSGADDVLFINELLSRVFKKYSINSNRVYALGMSGGGRMASLLACELSNKIAAIAPVTGLRYPETCNSHKPIPVISFHGELDTVNHYNLQQNSPTYWREGVMSAFNKWVKHNQCIKTKEKIENFNENITIYKYEKCAQNSEVIFYSSKNAGHTWPGSKQAKKFADYGLGITNTELPASELIWRFFKKHTLYQSN